MKRTAAEALLDAPSASTVVPTGMEQSDSKAVGLKAYFDNDKFSDFTIICRERRFKTHKIIISSHSNFFSNACEGGFKEGKTNEIELSEDYPEVIAEMLRYMYESDYDEPAEACATSFHAAMVGISDKYGVTALYEPALKKFKYALRECRGLEGYCNMRHLLENVSHIFQLLPDTNRDLRDPLVIEVTREFNLYRRDKAALDPTLYKTALDCLSEAVRSNSDFAADLINAIHVREFDLHSPVDRTRTESSHLLCNGCWEKFSLRDGHITLENEIYWNRSCKYSGGFICDHCLVNLSLQDFTGYGITRPPMEERAPFFLSY
ncbi:hypothetical protein NA57DRAFT_80273 [Rhizodiscina lignyota]|uniref:BTB domain-containing protein n=1 Tax=Rhizodiscina lignyota TaxID=1504668 RepID=A0A9P4M2F3_9PEZI|nr:hypothetical protein NA57DRAFT_80273 [Rhizodiscina lignyota]